MKGITQAFYGTTEEWENNPNPLYKGVFGIEVRQDGRRVTKVGDGETLWPLLQTIGQENIDDEEKARIAADEQLQAEVEQLQVGLGAEIQARSETDEQLQEDLCTETETREYGDVTLQENIDLEEAARHAADSTLQGNITAEAQ
ncbi:MAG: hypothetical protein LBK83_04415, partial [Treponema sp.]|nr:hypothetical protein [Treponema sp.]